MLNYDMTDCGGQPKYIHLYRCIRDDILSGKLSPSEKLPSKRNLARQLNIGVITVSNAYDLLVSEGFLTARERTGYFVQDIPPQTGFQETGLEAVPSDPVLSEELMESDIQSSDTRAYRNGMKLFPASIWNRLMRETMNQEEDLFALVPYNGLLDLRESIADYLSRSRGMKVNPAQIIISAGTESLLIRLCRLFGHSAIYGVEDPGYKQLASILSAFDNPTRFIPIDSEGLKTEALEESDVDIIHVTPANHFPSGVVLSAARRKELLDWAGRSSKRYIIEDDYDSEFRYQGSFVPPLYNVDTGSRVIYMNTFSKTLVPFLRISYMVLPPKLLKKYRSEMGFLSNSVSGFEQATLAKFISRGYFERHINRIRTYYRKLRSLVLDTLVHSPLGDISEIIENNAGTHFLVRVQTVLQDREIHRAAAEQDLPFRLYSDYGVYKTDENLGLFVLNYAAMAPEEVPDVVSRLCGIFPECR